MGEGLRTGEKSISRSKAELLFTMLLFGTIGTLSRFIDMPSGVICLGRAFFGVIIIIIVITLRKQSLDWEAIRRNAGWLLLSSVFMCLNWISQFEAFKHTTIAAGTLCYYMQPVFYILAGAIVLREKLSPRKMLCVIIAFCGMILVSGVLQTGLKLSAQTVGILSYIDPVEAVLLSAFFLKEPVTVFTIAGAVMILGAAAYSELGENG